MVESMESFFDARAEEYDEHMRAHLAAYDAFYDAVAAAIPVIPADPRILDLGIGTGAEVERIFARCPGATITGIDVSVRMLDLLRRKHADRMGRIRLLRGSFLELELGCALYDIAVSVMALHHWVPDVKVRLYRRIRQAIRSGGHLILADYIVDEGESAEGQRSGCVAAMGREQPLLHVDLPLTLDEERELLGSAGFGGIELAARFERAAVLTARA